jgi:hypothetical protein
LHEEGDSPLKNSPDASGPADLAFLFGIRVYHDQLGWGHITHVEKDTAAVLFENAPDRHRRFTADILLAENHFPRVSNKDLYVWDVELKAVGKLKKQPPKRSPNA